MTEKEKILITDSFRRVTSSTERFTHFFYRNLFDIDPTVKALFATANMTKQRQKLISMLITSIGLLDDPEKLEQEMQKLGVRHRSYGVQPHQYRPVGQAFLMALSQTLPQPLSPEEYAAWEKLYQFMVQAAITT